MATHTFAQIEEAVEKIAAAFKQVGIIAVKEGFFCRAWTLNIVFGQAKDAWPGKRFNMFKFTFSF